MAQTIFETAQRKQSSPAYVIGTEYAWAPNRKEIPYDIALQQMHELEEIQWRGGINAFDGKHDDFCFVCGSTMELFGCQTCDNCYHAECMTPELVPDEVPAFWFCPHCVNREWHVPSAISTISDSTTGSSHAQEPGSSELGLTAQTPESGNGGQRPGPSGVSTREKEVSQPNELGQPQDPGIRTGQHIPETQSAPKSVAALLELPPHLSEPQPNRGKTRHPRPKQPHSDPLDPTPPRKKSKYSTFSSSVEKALSIIHAELEKSASVNKSESYLQEKTRALEQRIRIQDGEMLLSGSELKVEKEKVEGLVAENERLKMEVEELRETVRRREGELREWRGKLRGLVGGELE